MLNLPLQPRHVLPPLCLIVLTMLLAWLGMNNELEFNRPLLEQGQLWRLFTSQFVHANWAHLALNCAGIGLIWLLHGEYTHPKQYSFNISTLALWCGLGVYWFCPTITIYTGISAVLHGVIVWGAIKDVTVGLKSGYVLFIGVWAKLIFEQVNGPSAAIGQLIQSTVAVDAHLIGAIGGVVLAVPLVVKHIKNTKKNAT
ncbi:rhombosortase [Pseudoalteromonas sp.]|uniref:rhombosortase n=1 Tax=Pseudoalteromonas sp. TaxID=53249 RepID=UPI001BCCFC00|nr:rhombosortase [Pseudoalteromonas sp.]